jgi:hypothetical protein
MYKLGDKCAARAAIATIRTLTKFFAPIRA